MMVLWMKDDGCDDNDDNDDRDGYKWWMMNDTGMLSVVLSLSMSMRYLGCLFAGFFAFSLRL